MEAYKRETPSAVNQTICIRVDFLSWGLPFQYTHGGCQMTTENVRAFLLYFEKYCVIINCYVKNQKKECKT